MRCTYGKGNIGDENCSGTRNSSGEKDHPIKSFTHPTSNLKIQDWHSG